MHWVLSHTICILNLQGWEPWVQILVSRPFSKNTRNPRGFTKPQLSQLGQRSNYSVLDWLCLNYSESRNLHLGLGPSPVNLVWRKIAISPMIQTITEMHGADNFNFAEVKMPEWYDSPMVCLVGISNTSSLSSHTTVIITVSWGARLTDASGSSLPCLASRREYLENAGSFQNQHKYSIELTNRPSPVTHEKRTPI